MSESFKQRLIEQLTTGQAKQQVKKLAKELYDTCNAFDDYINDTAEGNIAFSDDEFIAYNNDLHGIVKDLEAIGTEDAMEVASIANEVIDNFRFGAEKFDDVLNSGNMPSAKADPALKKYM